MRAILASVLLIAVSIPLVAFAAAPGAAVAPAATYTVEASDFAWTPADLVVAPGDSVEFVNVAGTHTWELADGSDGCDLPCVRTFADVGTVEYRCSIHPFNMLGTVHVGFAPTITIETPLAGDPVGGLMEVTGSASHVSSDIHNVSVHLLGAEPVDATLHGSGTSVTWSATVPTWSLANGPATLEARVTTESGLTTLTSILVLIDNPAFIDVGVTSLVADQDALTTNDIHFQLANFGNTPSGDVEVLVEYLYHGSWRAIGLVTVPSIAAGAAGSGSIVWEPAVPHVGAFEVRVTADPAQQLPDPVQENNMRTTTAGWGTTLVPGVIATEP